jgi:hypothetical protein
MPFVLADKILMSSCRDVRRECHLLLYSGIVVDQDSIKKLFSSSLMVGQSKLDCLHMISFKAYNTCLWAYLQVISMPKKFARDIHLFWE